MTRRPRPRTDDPFAFLDEAEHELLSARRSAPPNAHTSTLMPEDVVDGTWRIKTTLARGGFGVVFEAERLDEPDEVVALKLLDPPARDDEAWAARFVQEAEVTMAIRHPNVVRTHAHGRIPDGGRYLVMELLEGQTLGERARLGPRMPWDELALALEHLGAGLGAAHLEGIVHRDVTPANAFLVDATDDQPAALKVIDFGLCKGPWALTASTERMGTLAYLPPEVVRLGSRQAAVAGDVYGMALIAYELVTGQRAMVADSVPALMARIVRGPSPTPVALLRPETPPALRRAIEAGMAREPSHRPTDAAAYGRALAAAVTDALR